MLKEYVKLFDNLPENVSVFNIRRYHFVEFKNGDMIALCNLAAYLSIRYNRSISFYLDDAALQQSDHCFKFRTHLSEITTYISLTEGAMDLPLKKWNVQDPYGITRCFSSEDPTGISIWGIRGAIGDHVVITPSEMIQKKICINPVFDAPYNVYRNWTGNITQEIIDRFSTSEYDDYQKLFLCKYTVEGLDFKDFKLSQDFETNVNHIDTCSHYIGGDTGLTHYASALRSSPQLYYYMSWTGQLFTAPFYYGKNGEINLY